MVPTGQLSRILHAFHKEQHEPGFDLTAFIEKNFKLPPVDETYVTNKHHSVEEHIDELWSVMERTQQRSKGSLIGLPHPYIVAGGRFRAMFYWDSYFMMLGLATSGRWDMVENMVKNCAFLLRKYGHIPNGNRTYFVGRSQPPFFAQMLKLLAQHKGKRVLVYYLPYLLIEHHFWIKGSSRLRGTSVARKRVVHMPGGEILNRYYDDKATPRPEGYREDIGTVLQANGQMAGDMYRNVRAAAESGWDFSSRWLRNPEKLSTIMTTDIVPIDLNCLLVELERTIAEAYRILHSNKTAARYEALAQRRIDAINRYCWYGRDGFYYDYNIVTHARTAVPSLAGVFPLYAKIASQGQADAVARELKTVFLHKGGLVTTPLVTGQQWDSPNGWAPLQWMAIRGLRNYGHDDLADEIKKRWLHTCMAAYYAKGKLVEKYNVLEPSKAAGGGEYTLQDGFGWTNGVLLALLHEESVPWN
jgi:alpha,alpha-trehalase